MEEVSLEEKESIAIERIHKFAKIADAMRFDMCVGFSGGKDSQVVYDLMKRSDVPFKAYYNKAFESNTTKNFIKKHYPDVIWRQDYHFGFIQNIHADHSGMLPTVFRAYCCDDFKHNKKYIDLCSITGVRRAESKSRKQRTTIEVKNKTTLKKNKELIDSYFEEHCQSVGNQSIIQLKPIIDWTDQDVWNYIHKYNLPINPEYELTPRVGCIICPKANMDKNYIYLLKYPKLIDAFILAKQKGTQVDWIIKADENKDYSNDKPYYICRWLNHSFAPFSKSQEHKYKLVREKYDKMKQNNK